LASPVGSRVFGAPKPWDIVEDGLLMKWGVYYPYILTIIKIIQIIKNKYNNSNNNNINIYGLMIVGGYFWILPGF